MPAHKLGAQDSMARRCRRSWAENHDAAQARVGSRHLVLPDRNNRCRWHAAARTNPLVGSEEVRTREPACVQLRTQVVEQRCIKAERPCGRQALIRFTRGLGMARSGDLAGARVEIEAIKAL